jgi:hypothetical protein
MDEAIQVCNGDADGIVCPLRQQCLEFALVNNLAHGIFGGMYEHDRRRLRRDAREVKKPWHQAIEDGDWTWQEPTELCDDAPEEVEPEEDEYDPEAA